MVPLCNKIIDIAEPKLKQKISKKEKIKLLNTLSGAYNNIAFIKMNTGDIDAALKYLHISLEIVEEIGDKPGIATGINNIGYIYNNQGNVGKALDYYHRSLRIEEELNNDMGIATSLNNIASIYKAQGDTEKAFEYYKKSLIILEKIKNKKGIASVNNSLGSLYDEKGKNEEALKHYNIGLKIQKEIGFKEGQSNCLNNIGYLYFKQGMIDSALTYYYESLALREAIDDKDGIISSALRISKALLSQGKIKEAKTYAERAFQLSKEIGYPRNIKFSAQLLSDIYERQNNKSDALEMLKLFVVMNDSINNEDTKKATAKQQARYEYEKQKSLDDAEHQKQIAIEEEEKEKREIIIYGTVACLLIVAFLLYVIFRRLQLTRKQKIVIESAHAELEYKNQEILDSITYAKRIQKAILPTDKVVKEYLSNSFIVYKPKDIVAGDFYWLEHLNGKILFAAADCTGHGVPGAMVSVVCNNGLNRSVREHNLDNPGKILDKTQEIVVQEFEKSEDQVRDGMDIALCSFKDMELEYAGANNPLWLIRNGQLLETKANSQPIGRTYRNDPFKTHKIELQKGDTFYIFSDGYVDQFGGEKGKKLKAKAFKELLLSIQDKSMDEQKTILDNFFETWKGSLDQIDDVCIIGVRV